MTQKKFTTLLLLIFALLCPAETMKAGQLLRVLAIGNSFSEDAVEQNLYELAQEAGYELIIGNAYRGGQGLESHWKVVSAHTADFEYRKVAEGRKTNRTKVELDEILSDEPWDVITFQQVSQDAGISDTYEPWLSNLISYVKTVMGTRQVRYGFHQTWAYAKDAQHWGFAKYDRDQMKMYTSIVAAVRQTVDDNRDLSFVVPSGTAIQNARALLGDHLTRDGYHLDYGVGRYTTACTWLEAVTGASPIGLSYKPSTVSAEQAATAQEAAHEALHNPDACIKR